MSAYGYSVMAVMGLNVMLAVSLNMITGLCGQFSLGHAAFYGAGAYAAASFATAGATRRIQPRVREARRR